MSNSRCLSRDECVLTSGQLKAMCIEHLQKYVGGFQERRSRVTDAVVDEFMSIRPLEWKGNPKAPRADLVVTDAKPGEDGGEAGSGELSKNQLKKMLKEQKVAQKKAAKDKGVSGGS